MKTRDQVRPATRAAFKILGWALIALGFAFGVGLVVQQFRGLDAGAPWFLSLIFIGAGIPIAFPRTPLGHVLAAHFDAALDRWLRSDKEGD